MEYRAKFFFVLILCMACLSAAGKSGTYHLDFAPYANIGACDSPEHLTPLKNFDAKNFKFDVFGFKLVDPAHTGGKIAVLMKNNRPISFDFSASAVRGKNLYVLWTCDNSLKVLSGKCGEIKIELQSGEILYYYPKKEREFGNSADAAHYPQKAYPAYVDDKISRTGVVYFCRIPLPSNKETAVKKIVFACEGAIIFAAALDDKSVPSIKAHDFDMSQWRPVDLSNLEVADGSALDVSAGIEAGRAGKHGFLRVSDDGFFEFDKLRGKRVKFKGTNWRPAEKFSTAIKTHSDIDRLAKMTRKQGYNLVRWRMSLFGGEFESPWKLKPEILDMYDYFLYAFAREGVYTHLMLVSHSLGNPDFKWHERTEIKFRMILGDKSVWEDWRKVAKMQLEHVNPYTKLAWKDDPSIATLEYFNEIEHGWRQSITLSPEVRKWANGLFRVYLKSKYASFDEWQESNARNNTPWKYGSPKSFDDVEIFRGTYRHPDWMRFVVERARLMSDFCKKVVREEIGAKMPVHQNNIAIELGWGMLAAESGDYVSTNAYHAHADGWTLGSYCDQSSSLADAAGYFRRTSAKRVAGKPMMYSEYQHCHWNRLKHEAGVVFPSYAALQDFDNLTIHDAAIAAKGDDYTFGHAIVNNSPVFRANEFLSYCLFLRGDVSPAKHRTDVLIDKNFIEKSPYFGNALNIEESKIALMTGFALAYESPRIALKRHKPADIVEKPVGTTFTVSTIQATSTGESAGGNFDVAAFEKLLRSKGILSAANATDSANGIFQSETGEITLRQRDELVKTVAPKTEAVALKPSTKNERLGRLFVKSTSVPACVAVASVDGKPLSESGRMVLIYNTDNIASGFKVSVNYTNSIANGSYPILMSAGRLSAELKLPKGKTYSLYLLKITGSRIKKLPMPIENGVAKIEIDTAKEPEISPFFEICAE